MPSYEEIQKAKILNSFNTDEGLSELTKAEILDIEKGGKRAMIGEKRTFAGREYIKTSDGWKFHGKGTGSKAQSHVAGALEHRVAEGTAENKHSKLTDDELEEDFGIATPGPGEKPSDDFKELKKELLKREKDPKSKFFAGESHKDATDHFVEEDGKHYIDTLDPDSGERVFKPGDKIHYKDDSGKHHKGTISDREHEDGDMFEVDREGDSHKGEDSKEAHEKRGFKEELGDEDVTGKTENISQIEHNRKQLQTLKEMRLRAKQKGDSVKDIDKSISALKRAIERLE